MAIFVSLAAVSVRGHVDTAKLELLLDRIEALVSRIRDEAQRRQAPDELRVDVDRGLVYQFAGGKRRASSRELSLDDTVEIDLVRTGNRTGRHGELRVPISLHGQSDSYALRLKTTSGRSVWLVVLGTTGQCLRITEEKDVARFLSPLAS
jgi:hypothetical protein